MTVELSDCSDSESGTEVQDESITQYKLNSSCYRRSPMLMVVIIFLIWSTLIIVIPEVLIGICVDGYDKIGVMIGFLLLGLAIVSLSTVMTKTIIDNMMVRCCDIEEV